MSEKLNLNPNPNPDTFHQEADGKIADINARVQRGSMSQEQADRIIGKLNENQGDSSVQITSKTEDFSGMSVEPFLAAEEKRAEEQAKAEKAQAMRDELRRFAEHNEGSSDYSEMPVESFLAAEEKRAEEQAKAEKAEQMRNELRNFGEFYSDYNNVMDSAAPTPEPTPATTEPAPQTESESTIPTEPISSEPEPQVEPKPLFQKLSANNIRRIHINREPTTVDDKSIPEQAPIPAPALETAPKNTPTIEERISAIEIDENGKINLGNIKDYVIDRFAEINDKAGSDSEKLAQKKELIANLLEEVRLMQDFLNKASSIINDKGNEPTESFPEVEPKPTAGPESEPTSKPVTTETAPAAEKEPVSAEIKEKAGGFIAKMEEQAVSKVFEHFTYRDSKGGVVYPPFTMNEAKAMFSIVYPGKRLDDEISDNIGKIWQGIGDRDRSEMLAYLQSPAQKGNSYAITAWLKANNLFDSPELRPAA